MGDSARVKGGFDEVTLVQRTKSKREGPRKGPAFLTVLTGDSVGTVFELRMGETLIGRVFGVDVLLGDDGVSRQHAKIIREEDGSAKLVDLDSTNGTYLNGRRIHAEGLREGDRIRVGQSATLDFRYSYRDSSVLEMLPGGSKAIGARAGRGRAPTEPDPHAREAEPDTPVPLTRDSSDKLNDSYDNLAATLDSLGKVYAKQGKLDDAISAYRRTLEIREMKFGKEHPAVASILDALGTALQDAGEPDTALDCHRRALAIYESQSRRPPRETGHVLAQLGRCQLALGQAPAALGSLERAHAMLRSHGATSAELARVRFTMAKTLHTLDRDEDRRLDLAMLARDAFAAGGNGTRELYAEVVDWLAQFGV
ncbi:MAG: tetratricopeptide repeat protein [Myxococcales bacterium]|nr:tetratricopeptide repeat protein [Myxococcales bacterium]